MIIVLAAAVPGMGAEEGRVLVKDANPPATRSGYHVPVVGSGAAISFAAESGVELGLNWNSIDWDVGSHAYSDEVWAPQLAVFFGVGDRTDVRAAVTYLSTDAEPDEGVDADIDLVRAGIGSKFCVPLDGSFIPYVAGYLNFYIPSVSGGSGEEGMFGVSGELGVAYATSDAFLLQIGLHAETTLDDGSATGEFEPTVDGEETVDLSVQAVGVGIAMSVLF